MSSFFIIFSFVFGLLIGSFLNVVALRYNSGMTLGGRSKCFSCGSSLSWYELIPLFSFLSQKGKCRTCKSKISWQYPLVEALAGILFVLLFMYFPPVDAFTSIRLGIYLIITCILLVTALYDMKHKILPDALVFTFAGIALAQLFITPELTFKIPDMYALLAGPILAAPFALLWAVSKGRWMGLGDAKLMLGIGWLLGIMSGISAIILAFWIGAVVSVIWMYVVLRKFKSHYEIPFGPYLILGMYLVLLFNIHVISFFP